MKKEPLKQKMNQLFEHQKSGIEFLKTTKHAILADEMGLGKTRQAIIAADEDRQHPALVICPASLKINWQREINIVYPEMPVLIVESGPTQQIAGYFMPRWIVINYDLLSKYLDQLLPLFPERIDTLVIDEAHYIKGTSIRAKNTLELAKKASQVYCLTGTPVMNRPIELFNILRAIDHPLGKNKGYYSKRYCGAFLRTIIKKNGQVLRFWDDTGATRLPELRSQIAGSFLRRTKKEVLDLPEKIVSVQVCDLTKDQLKMYDAAWDSYLLFLEQNPDEERDMENIISAQHLIELTKLKQVCSLSKLDRIEEDAHRAIESGQKVLIFSQYTETIKSLAERLRQKQSDQRGILVSTLTGQDDMKTRQRAVDDFQFGRSDVFIANIKAGGVGLNLSAATIVMFADMDWSPEIHVQAEDRAHRIGQEGTVNVYYYVVKETIEEDIVDLLEQKKILIAEITEGTRGASYSLKGEFAKRLKERVSRSRY